MATYEVKGPDGATYEVEGPDGATDAQIIGAIKAQIAGEEKVEEPTLPQSGIYAGVERDVSTSDASLPDEVAAEQSVGARFVEKVNDYDPTKDEGVAQELFEGIASGVIGIGQGIGELGASAVDVVADTDYSTAVTKGAQELREELGIDPVGLVGKGAEIITQFVVPGAVAVGAVSKLGKAGKFLNYLSGKIGGKTTAFSPTKLGRLSEAARKGKAGKLVGAEGKLTRGQKFALLGQEAAALGVTEFVVATDGITTIGDFFEGGPTQTDREVGLSGREEALRKIGNKFSSALEATGIGVVAPPVLSVIGSTASTALRVNPLDFKKLAVAKATGKTVPAKDIRPGVAPIAARFALDRAGKVGSYFDELENARKGGQALTKPKAFLADLLAGLRYRGYLPEEAAEVRALIEGMTEADIKTATITLNRIEQNLNDKVLSKYASKGADDTDLARQSFFNKVEDFMTAPTKAARTTAFENLPDWAKSDVSSMRQQVDNLSKDLLESDFIKKMDGVLGPDGGGSAIAQGLTTDDCPIYMATLGKALGSYGAFVAGSDVLIETLIQFSRNYIYTTALPPAIAAASLAAVKLLQHEVWRQQHLNHLIRLFKQQAEHLRLPLMPSGTAIQPLLIGSSEMALRLSESLKEMGFLVTAIRPPTVPKNTARLRITLSAAHTENHLQQLLAALLKLQHQGLLAVVDD